MVSSSLARIDSGDAQPESNVTPVSTRTDSAAGAKVVVAATPNAQPRQVVLYRSDRASATALADVLVRRGFEVRSAVMFCDLGGWLLHFDHSAVLVVELPSVDTFRQAVLHEVRRIAKGAPVIALTKVVTPDVERDTKAAGVVRVLPTDADSERIIAAIGMAREEGQSERILAKSERSAWEDG